MSISDNWKLILDKFEIIFIITLSDRRNDRCECLAKQITGKEHATDKDLLDNNVHVLYATRFPHNNLIIKAFNESKAGKLQQPNEYDCSRNHYAAIKIAYDLNCKNVLVIEDDVLINKNFNIINNYINSIPSDYNILRFGGFTTNPSIKHYMNNSITWYRNNFPLWMTSMYALDRIGMQYYINSMDEHFDVAPMPFINVKNSNMIHYFPAIPLIIQADRKESLADITPLEKDHIARNRRINLYECNIDYNDYADYTY